MTLTKEIWNNIEKTYRVTRLPRFLVFTINRLKKNEFFVEKDIAKARETFNEIILLDNAIDSGFNASAKYLVSLQGIPMTTVTRTGSSVNEARRRSIEAYYEYAKEHGMLK